MTFILYILFIFKFLVIIDLHLLKQQQEEMKAKEFTHRN